MNYIAVRNHPEGKYELYGIKGDNKVLIGRYRSFCQAWSHSFDIYYKYDEVILYGS